MRCNPSTIEKKWQQRWRKARVYEPSLKGARRPFYNLMMFPYPSAEGLHIGAARTFSGVDIYGRFKRMQGHAVFEPIGLDGFGIHSENYALKIGKHPVRHARDSQKNFYRQLAMLGNGFAWNERLETYDPRYYRWTQWIFTQLFKRGLAYRKKQAVNWCPSCKTVLADEQAISGQCERCGSTVLQKELEQWFFKITDYAEHLLKNLNRIDWSERVKTAQRNWIGKSEGALIRFSVIASEPRGGERGNPAGLLRRFAPRNDVGAIEVFTTRPDTLFGATYLVLAPEHQIIAGLESRITNYEAVKEYANAAKTKTDDERIAEGMEKTGVELQGIKAINPANNEEIPVWISDYVLGHVGTGAIMAVPAHDQRDFEFAMKLDLPIRQVIAPETGRRRPNEEFRDGGTAVVFDPKTQKYAVAHWKRGGKEWYGLFSGGNHDGEDIRTAVLRELTEESGLYDFARVEPIETAFAHYHNTPRNIDRFAKAACFLVVLKTARAKERTLEPHEDFAVAWVKSEELLRDLEKNNGEHTQDHWIRFLKQAAGRAVALGYDTTSDPSVFFQNAYTDEGALINSGHFNGMPSEKARWAITRFAKGKRVTRYRLRDWLVSRQRYWGPPIPMIHCTHCANEGKGEQKDMPGWYAVPERDLPVRLPLVKNFKPLGTGVGPLASVPSFYKVACPKCRREARRETDVSDAFLDSAWYFLRYPSVRDARHPWTPAITGKWLPVDMYIGGAEHSVLHLLYARFLTMVFHDWGMLRFEEPFTRFRAHGLITKDGAKMSKSKGNVVNPDEYFKAYGADAMRMYLAFLAPFEQNGDFQDTGIRGITRFLERVWKLQNAGDKNALQPRAERGVERKEVRAKGGVSPDSSNSQLLRTLHQTIKKVTEDVENLQYNTAISALMTLLNAFEEHAGALAPEHVATFLKLLAPFAPHLTEELWQRITARRARRAAFQSIHCQPWPRYDEKLIRQDTARIIIQVNGKVRDQIEIAAGATEKAVKTAALERENVRRWLDGKEIQRIIVVPKRLINIVIG